MIYAKLFILSLVFLYGYCETAIETARRLGRAGDTLCPGLMTPVVDDMWDVIAETYDADGDSVTSKEEFHKILEDVKSYFQKFDIDTSDLQEIETAADEDEDEQGLTNLQGELLLEEFMDSESEEVRAGILGFVLDHDKDGVLSDQEVAGLVNKIADRFLHAFQKETEYNEEEEED